jgi:hypothetical protein
VRARNSLSGLMRRYELDVLDEKRAQGGILTVARRFV